jgi:hypothetical protein
VQEKNQKEQFPDQTRCYSQNVPINTCAKGGYLFISDESFGLFGKAFEKNLTKVRFRSSPHPPPSFNQTFISNSVIKQINSIINERSHPFSLSKTRGQGNKETGFYSCSEIRQSNKYSIPTLKATANKAWST